MLRKSCLFLGALALVVGTGAAVLRVRYHVRTEVVSLSAPRLATRSAELMREALYEGQHVVFEVCSIEPDAFGPAFRDKLAFEVVVVSSNETALRVVVDDARIAEARRGREGVCISIGVAARLGGTGVFALRMEPLEALPHRVSHFPLVGRIVAVTPVSDADLLPVLAALLGVVLVLAGVATKPGDVASPPIAAGPAYVGVALSAAALVLALFAGAVLPRWGALSVLMNAGLVVVVEIACVLLVPRLFHARPRSLIALEIPRARTWLVLAPFIGLALHLVGSYLSRLVPSTGVAPIETLVSQTSGFLAVALVSVVAPVVEELFFRGLVYGTLAQAQNENVAAVLSLVVFVLVHVPQDYGAWGPLASITLTGAVLVGLRRASGSLLVPAVAHLTHNAAITILSFAAHAG